MIPSLLFIGYRFLPPRKTLFFSSHAGVCNVVATVRLPYHACACLCALADRREKRMASSSFRVKERLWPTRSRIASLVARLIDLTGRQDCRTLVRLDCVAVVANARSVPLSPLGLGDQNTVTPKPDTDTDKRKGRRNKQKIVKGWRRRRRRRRASRSSRRSLRPRIMTSSPPPSSNGSAHSRTAAVTHLQVWRTALQGWTNSRMESGWQRLSHRCECSVPGCLSGSGPHRTLLWPSSI